MSICLCKIKHTVLADVNSKLFANANKTQSLTLSLSFRIIFFPRDQLLTATLNAISDFLHERTKRLCSVSCRKKLFNGLVNEAKLCLSLRIRIVSFVHQMIRYRKSVASVIGFRMPVIGVYCLLFRGTVHLI